MSRFGLLAGFAPAIAALMAMLSPIAVAAPPTRAGSTGPFVVSSAAFADGGMMSLRYAGNRRDCGGENVSPPLAWRNAPAGTRSFAVVVFDVDGRIGLGVVHWVVYGIPADVTTLQGAAGAVPGAGFVGGMNMQNSPRYDGPCPPRGSSFHHYIFSVYALDLAPSALSTGLSRDGLLAAMNGHILAASSIVARFARQ